MSCRPTSGPCRDPSAPAHRGDRRFDRGWWLGLRRRAAPRRRAGRDPSPDAMEGTGRAADDRGDEPCHRIGARGAARTGRGCLSDSSHPEPDPADAPQPAAGSAADGATPADRRTFLRQLSTDAVRNAGRVAGASAAFRRSIVAAGDPRSGRSTRARNPAQPSAAADRGGRRGCRHRSVHR